MCTIFCLYRESPLLSLYITIADNFICFVPVSSVPRVVLSPQKELSNFGGCVCNSECVSKTFQKEIKYFIEWDSLLGYEIPSVAFGSSKI